MRHGKLVTVGDLEAEGHASIYRFLDLRNVHPYIFVLWLSRVNMHSVVDTLHARVAGSISIVSVKPSGKASFSLSSASWALTLLIWRVRIMI